LKNQRVPDFFLAGDAREYPDDDDSDDASWWMRLIKMSWSFTILSPLKIF